jgi:hypothetical protein
MWAVPQKILKSKGGISMFAQKLSVVAIGCIIALSLCLAACGKKLTDEEFSSLDKAVEKKLQAIVQKFESVGLKEAAECGKSADTVVTKAGTFVISSTIAAEFYNPESKPEIKGNEIILPISGVYSRVDNADDAEFFFRKGWKFRDVTISVFARNEKRYFDPVITKRREFK